MTINDTVLYITLSIPWGVAGWLAGFVTGYRAILWSRTMPTTLIDRPTEAPPKSPDTALPWYRRSRFWLGTAVAAIGLFTAGQWYFQGEDTQRVAEDTKRIATCQAAYANGFADAIDARTKESYAVADGQDQLWMIFQEGVGATPPADIRERFRVKLNEYLTARAKVKAAQAENPLPPAPRDLCK
jgi:hypothetical protein